MTFRFSAVTYGFIAFVFSIGAAIVLTCLGNSPSFAATFTAQGGGANQCTPGDGSGYNLSNSPTPVAGSAFCIGTGSLTGTSGNAASGASAGHVGASATSVTTNNGTSSTLSASAFYSDMFTFHSSSTSADQLVSLNLNVGGTMAVGASVGAAVASVDLNVRINGFLVGSLHSVLDTTGTPSCSSSFGGNAGCSGAVFVGNTPLLTNTSVVPLNTAVPVQLSLMVNAFSINSGSSSSVEFGESLDFLIGSALFNNLPDGVIVDAPDSFVFNNIFAPPTSATPLPAALPLFAGGLGAIGLLARRRKRKQAA